MAFGDIILRAESATTVSEASLTTTFGSTPTSGNLLISVWETGASDVTGVASGGNPWTLAKKWQTGTTENDCCAVFWRIAGAGEATDVVATPSATDEIAQLILEVEGPWESSPVDQTTDPGKSTGATYGVGTTGTLAQADEFACAAAYTREAANNDQINTTFSGTGWTYNGGTVGVAANSTNKSIHVAHQVTSATTALSGTYNWAASALAMGGIVTFKKQAAGGPAAETLMGQICT